MERVAVAFAYVPSQMHASARNFKRLHRDLAWLEDGCRGSRRGSPVLAGGSDLVTPPGATRVLAAPPRWPNARMDVVSRGGPLAASLRPI